LFPQRLQLPIVAGVFGSFPKKHCVAKAICESFRDSYLLAIFILWVSVAQFSCCERCRQLILYCQNNCKYQVLYFLLFWTLFTNCFVSYV